MIDGRGEWRIRATKGLYSGVPMPLTRDAVIAFMKAEPRPICPACLTRALGLPFDRVLDAWADIRLRGDLPIQPGLCAACGARATAVMCPQL